MPNIKIVLNDPKTGRSCQVEANEDATKKLVGMKLGETLKGELLDLNGYEFKITGGSDHAGFPLRADLRGAGRRKILTKTGVVGVKKVSRNGTKVRKTVCANTITDKTAQINAMITKTGKTEIEGLKPKEEKPKEGEEKPAEDKKE